MSNLAKTFTPVVPIKFAASPDEFVEAIEQCSKNDYLLYEDDQPQPLEYTNLKFDHPQRQYFYIQADDGEIIAAQTLRQSPKNENIIWAMDVSTHPDHHNKGYAKSLIWASMQYINNLGKVLSPSSFEDDGWKYLAKVFPAIHQQFPNLKITYDDVATDEEIECSSITGEKPYTLAPNGYGDCIIILD